METKYTLSQALSFLSGELDDRHPETAAEIRKDLADPKSEISQFYRELRERMMQLANVDWNRIENQQAQDE